MPAHVAHLILAEDALGAALGAEGEEILQQHGNFVRLGAQGPDLFYHNRRTYPSALRYGTMLHRRGYGSFTAAMIAKCREMPEARAYLFGFATHACLDRHTHPYIVYRSGWTDPADPESSRYYRCHAFLERILDVIFLKERRGTMITDLDIPALLSVGPDLPRFITEPVASALELIFRRRSEDPDIRQRVANAYADSMAYYRHSNPADPSCREQALLRERASPEPLRILALHHPVALPDDLDFANALHSEWRHPCDPDDSRTTSFSDLYDRALEEARPVLCAVAAGLRGEREDEEVARIVGDHGLDANPPHAPCTPRCSAPFPLGKILDSYRAPAV